MRDVMFTVLGIPFYALPIIHPCDYTGGGGSCSAEKRKQARERRRWKKIHTKQGRQ